MALWHQCIFRRSPPSIRLDIISHELPDLMQGARTESDSDTLVDMSNYFNTPLQWAHAFQNQDSTNNTEQDQSNLQPLTSIDHSYQDGEISFNIPPEHQATESLTECSKDKSNFCQKTRHIKIHG